MAWGSCFADHVVGFLTSEVGIEANSFAQSRFYDPASILQTIRHLFVEPQYGKEDLFRTDEGQWAYPFRNPRFRADSYEELKEWSDGIEAHARAGLESADLIILTLGGIETWRHAKTRKSYITIPFPDVFNGQMPDIAEFHVMTFEEVFRALEEIVEILFGAVPPANIVITVSPIRMAFTTSRQDVTLATSHGKSILRAAVGELTRQHREQVHYFHSYEIVQYAPPELHLFAPDNSHVSELAVNMVMHEFSRCYLAQRFGGDLPTIWFR